MANTRAEPNDVALKRAKRGRSGAVRPVKWGLIRTKAVKIKNRYGQVNGHFHAQSGTCLASLPSWPCRFDPGHPLQRKTLTQQGFSRGHGLRVLLKRRSCVRSGAVCTTPYPAARTGIIPGTLAIAVRSRASLPRNPYTARIFTRPPPPRTSETSIMGPWRGGICHAATAAPARQAGHAGSISRPPAPPAALACLRRGSCVASGTYEPHRSEADRFW